MDVEDILKILGESDQTFKILREETHGWTQVGLITFNKNDIKNIMENMMI